MKITKIPKKQKGKFREIAIPTHEEKLKYWAHLHAINEKAKKLCSGSVHGFLPGRSPVTNAAAHVGFRYSLSFDLSDFFDTVKPENLNGKLSKEEITDCMPDGRAYQGLPTSPAIANLAALDMDRAILKFIGNEVVYTRYADDLTFSFNDFQWVAKLKEKINEIVARCGFKINHSKTRLQDARFGRRGITGVSVGEDIAVSRKIRRKIRAAKHQENKESLKGLEEWAKLKMPKDKTLSYSQKDIDNLTKVWNIKKVDLKDIPEKNEVIFEDKVILTGDLPYILGPSDWATNWTSCLCHARSGINHKKVNFWAYLRGTRIAGLLSDEETTIAGVKRKKLKARVYVHKLRDHGEFYDNGQVYGENEGAKMELRMILEKNGINPLTNAPRGVKVEGNVGVSQLAAAPYPGSLKIGTAKGFYGKWTGNKVYFAKT